MISDPAKKTSPPRVIRDKAFAKRIEHASETHPHTPKGHGKQKWLKLKLEEKFNISVSTEAVRKWFAGEARPKPELMSFVARIYEVDEAWLSLGISPTKTPIEKRKQNALTGGAVNLVAAQIQLAGGNIAFPEGDDENDIFAIVNGKQRSLVVRLAENPSEFTLSLPLDAGLTIVVLPTDTATVYRFFRIPAETISGQGDIRGNYTELVCSVVGKRLLSGDQEMPEIVNFTDLEGVVHGRKSS